MDFEKWCQGCLIRCFPWIDGKRTIRQKGKPLISRSGGFVGDKKNFEKM